MQHEELRQLLDKAVCGDDDSWNRLVTEFKPIVFAAIYKVFKGTPDMSTRDCAQVVWAKVSNNLSDFQGRFEPTAKRETFVTWLSRAATTSAQDLVRYHRAEKRAFRAARITPDIEASIRTPSSLANEQMLNDELRAAIEKLEPLTREIIELRFFEALTIREVAEVVDTTVDKVRTRIEKATQELRAFLPGGTWQ
ncbi:MAG: sigma-70 family RNA polymerase sigma factor [Fuerstiella sp.]